MESIRFLETPAQHGSDYIRWYDATGFNESSFRPRVKQALNIRLDNAPRDLVLQHRLGLSALWRENQSGAAVTIAGRARGDQLLPPVETPYIVEGKVYDLTRKFNPRNFNITAGNAAGHELALYRSPLGTQVQSAGALRASISYDNDAPASWAIVTVTVTPFLGSPLEFSAQADIHGDVLLPLTRLPALTYSAPSANYAALLQIRADGNGAAEFADPDNFVAFLVADFSSPATFNTSVSFDVSPGGITDLASAGENKIVIQST